MAAHALVQTRIDAEVRDRASAVFERMGLTVSNAVRILLTRTANEGALPLELFSGSEAHDAWFRTKVLEASLDRTFQMLMSRHTSRSAGRRRASKRVLSNREVYMVCVCAVGSRRHIHLSRQIILRPLS